MIKTITSYFDIRSKLTQFSVLIFLFSLTSLFQLFNQPRLFYSSAVSLVLIHIFILVYYLISKKYLHDKLLNLQNIIISTNIIYLIVHPMEFDGFNNLAFFDLFLAVFLGVICNRFLRYKGFPIFNPAALAVLLTFIFTSLLVQLDLRDMPIFISWWGANLLKISDIDSISNFVTALIVGSLFVYYSNGFKKFYYGFVFLISYFLLYFGFAIMDNQTINGTLLHFINVVLTFGIFFAFVMLSEPKTSPIGKEILVIYGFIAAFVYFLLDVFSKAGFTNFGFLDLGDNIAICTIILMNLIYFIQKYTKNVSKNKSYYIKQ
ncbi:MAG: hypothetical protein KatS3mg084_0353 [Candidatus Dojkabacteria bacterium]|nr:MAG: hypothetical protein KatS3mg084_0353 [Candidatus Dojkabacteria bacterium]